MSYRVGLTGGIGSGKSTVASLFAELGAAIIDTDLISHQLTAPGGTAIPAIRAAFGDTYITPDGALDRARMRELVFADTSAKSRLESILHPLILAETQSRSASSPARYTLVVVPLLFETPAFRHWLNRTLTVDCSEAAQLARAGNRPGMSGAMVRAIIAQQMDRAERLRRSDDVIPNDDGLDDLRKRVGELHQLYLRFAQTSN